MYVAVKGGERAIDNAGAGQRRQGMQHLGQ